MDGFFVFLSGYGQCSLVDADECFECWVVLRNAVEIGVHYRCATDGLLVKSIVKGGDCQLVDVHWEVD
jgi:hypothetical protein